MPNTSITPKARLSLLAEMPTRLAAVCADRSTKALQRRSTPRSGPRALVLAHLRACADIWGHCMLAVLEEDTPTWRAVNPLTWIKQTNYFELDFQPSLDSFATLCVTRHGEIPATLLRSPCARRGGVEQGA